MDWPKAPAGKDKADIPKRWLHLHYYEALSVLFRIENALRALVYVVLKEEFHEKWLEVQFPGDKGPEGTIDTIARRRRSQEEACAYLGHPVTCPLLYLAVGELVRMITSPALWKYFAAHFPAVKEVVETKFLEMGIVRNSLAHFRPINIGYVETVKVNASHMLGRTEVLLRSVLECSAPVPTNTQDPWYLALAGLKTDLCVTGCLQSSDEKWVRIALRYLCPIVEMSQYAGWRRIRVLNVRTPALLKEFPSIKNKVLFVNEVADCNRPRVGKGDVKIYKQINMIFGRKTLADHFDLVVAELKKALDTVASETKLVLADNLARGALIEAVETHIVQEGEKGQEEWRAMIAPMSHTGGPDDPPEYWGKSGEMPARDFISDTTRFPWMMVDVADEDDTIPF